MGELPADGSSTDELVALWVSSTEGVLIMVIDEVSDETLAFKSCTRVYSVLTMLTLSCSYLERRHVSFRGRSTGRLRGSIPDIL